MFNPDKPISKSSEDVLGRTEFANSLANAILKYELKESITLGLYGKWGSGKSSLINLIVEEIEEHNDIDDKVIIIKFNPWNITEQNQVITEFFTELISKLPKLKKKNKNKPNLGELLKVYSILLVAASNQAEIGIAALIAGKVFEFLGRRIVISKKDMNSNNNISTIKENINKELLKLNKKVLIIIDDIDRLNKKEVRQIFQLTKVIADFPNMIYVLSFDRDIVIEALNGEQKENGLEYLEKIVQIPFAIPEVEVTKVHNLLFSKIDEVIGVINDDEFDQKHWSKIFHYGISKWINNIRDVTRVMNIFSFKYSLINKEVNFIDLFALVVLEIFEPIVFEEIKNNKELFVGRDIAFNKMNNELKVKEIELIINMASNDKREAVKNILIELFPQVGKYINKWSGTYFDENNARKNSLVSCYECFDTYFKMSLGANCVSKVLVKELLFEGDEKFIAKTIIEINEKKKINNFFDLSKAFIDDLKMSDKINDRVYILLNQIYNNWSVLVDPDEMNFLSMPFIWRLQFFTEGLLETISDRNVRYAVVQKIILDRKIPLELRLSQLISLEQQHNRFTEKSSSRSNSIINLEHVVEIEEKLYLEISERSKKSENDYELIKSIYFWKAKNETELISYISKILETDEGLVKLIAKFVGIGKASGDFTYQIFTFHKSSFEEYYDVETAFNRVEDILTTDCSLKYSEDEIKKLVAFYISAKENNYESKAVKDIEKVYEELLRKWKYSYY